MLRIAPQPPPKNKIKPSEPCGQKAAYVVPTMAAKVDASCKQVFDAAAARARVAVVRHNGIDGVQSEESCRAYANQFFEAVKARQAAAICEDGLDHQRDLELLDAGIEAVNNLVASQCSS
jgi:tartrate dehydratase beta subunit/fumarate hydratase class I family protein